MVRIARGSVTSIVTLVTWHVSACQLYERLAGPRPGPLEPLFGQVDLQVALRISEWTLVDHLSISVISCIIVS